MERGSQWLAESTSLEPVADKLGAFLLSDEVQQEILTESWLVLPQIDEIFILSIGNPPV